ncbi:MAG: sel1 repeat family protein [Ruminococcus flavefaciens]|nr:sel1 repeat family protein [Ruminococcus flavefaciens]
MYFHGLGTPINNQKSIEYFEKSAEQGNQYAKRLLAWEYISGKNLEKDIGKGISLLTECADGGDAFSCYKLGNLYLNGEVINQDLDKAEKYLLSAEDNEFTQYTLGKLYLQKEKYDIEKTISYFKKSADKNMWSSYQLGRIYLLGANGLEKDKEKAVEFLNLSAEQGNEYAQNIIDNQEKFENEMLASTIFSLFINLSRCIEDYYHNKFNSGRKMIDSKLRRMIKEKNQALGIKEERGQTQEY